MPMVFSVVMCAEEMVGRQGPVGGGHRRLAGLGGGGQRAGRQWLGRQASVDREAAAQTGGGRGVGGREAGDTRSASVD
ncbi:hypothetical protein GUJ93_ZPchr0009g788 [Zizania palustris]|uniref:Uncharacterized protein n=1 Tax=Zizania palustris TaxID=103762 RepID=A0A8J5VMJ6_ZIZPA|nr:hypothetical protein GUJ93_ZPchr0009g788 [Zizania palustris]